jgi:hypothetical protein
LVHVQRRSEKSCTPDIYKWCSEGPLTAQLLVHHLIGPAFFDDR